MALDRFGRAISYLRISLTDHCNLRCVYCMPEEMTFRPSAELMQDDEVIFLVRLFASLGFHKIRLTGGEPTVRAHIVDLVRAMAQTPGMRTISMTTNGILLDRLAYPLVEAGLKRVNISLDTLDPEKFHRLTRWGQLEDVWAGIRAAEEAGLAPIKLNAVIVRGYNEGDVVDLARLTYQHAWQVRFIEMMPFAGATELQIEQMVTAQEVQERIQIALSPLELVNDGNLDGEARLYHLPGAKGDLGFISTVTQPFCASCKRTPDRRWALAPLSVARREVDLLTRCARCYPGGSSPANSGRDLE
jgi:cyclic pyranopterin phosphate synthase